MSDTPRTDNLEQYDSRAYHMWYVASEDCRTLERELAAVTAERDAFKHALDNEAAHRYRVIAERDALRKDAERYRWLRDNHRGRALSVSALDWTGDPCAADTAIDAAMRGKEGA